MKKPIFLEDQGGSVLGVVKEDVSPCMLASTMEKGHSLVCIESKPKVIAFAQNKREEVRMIGGDGSIAGCVSAECGSHQTTYLCIISAHGINRNRVLCMDSKIGFGVAEEICQTILATVYKEPPIIIQRRECHGN